MLSHATATCCQTLSDASTVKLAELRTAFHFFLQVCCSVSADSEDSIIILTAHKWLLPAAITRIKCWHAFLHRCTHTEAQTHTQKYKHNWTHNKLEIQLKVCLGDLRSCTLSSWQLECCEIEKVFVSVCPCVYDKLWLIIIVVVLQFITPQENSYTHLAMFPWKHHHSDTHTHPHTRQHTQTHMRKT